MSIQDDIFDVEDALDEAIEINKHSNYDFKYAKVCFSRLHQYIGRLEVENYVLRDENETLRKTVKIIRGN